MTKQHIGIGIGIGIGDDDDDDDDYRGTSAPPAPHGTRYMG